VRRVLWKTLRRSIQIRKVTLTGSNEPPRRFERARQKRVDRRCTCSSVALRLICNRRRTESERAHIDACHYAFIAKLRHTHCMSSHDILCPKHIVQAKKSFRHRHPHSSRVVCAPVRNLVLLSAYNIIKDTLGALPEDKACQAEG
jgi:hypothetical protein